MTQDRMTFSFRCSRPLKDSFSAKAKANGTTASALIKDFMQAYVDGSNDKSIDNKNQSTDIINLSVLEELRSRIAALEAKVDSLAVDRNQEQKVEVEDDVGTNHPQNDTACDQAEIDIPEQSENILTSNQTFTSKEIAQEYGISSENLHRWRRGKRKPSGNNVEKWNEIKEKYHWDDSSQRWRKNTQGRNRLAK